MPRKDALHDEALRDRWEGTSDHQWWRSLEELAETEEFQAYLHREFPERASQWLGGSRRDFLRLMGASLALAGLSGCRIRQPEETIVPAVHEQGGSTLGKPDSFTTATELAGEALGLVVESRSGRPIKVEGNRHHPASLGATNIFAQAATLDLYDPGRAQVVRRGDDVVSMEALTRELSALARRLDEKDGWGFRILAEPSTSPTRSHLLEEIRTRWPEVVLHSYGPVNTDNARRGASMAFGKEFADIEPLYHFDRCRVVLSVDCDFLAARDLAPRYVRVFAKSRTVLGREMPESGRPPLVQLYHLGSLPTLTSAKADHHLTAAPEIVSDVLAEVARRIGGEVGERNPRGPENDEPRFTAWADAVAEDLKEAGAEALVVAGREQPAEVHALVHAINGELGCVGTTVQYFRSPRAIPKGHADEVDSLRHLVDAIGAGDVHELLILGGNPAFDAPADFDFAQVLRQVPHSYSVSLHENETSACCHWRIPRSHFLESWGDVRWIDGTRSIVQPLISPLYESRSEIEILSGLLGETTSGYEAVRATLRDDQPDDDAFEARWRRSLRDGVVPNSASQAVELPDVDGASVVEAMGGARPVAEDDSILAVVFRPDPTVWDGRFANNGWLQELPKPLTKLTWDNCAWISRLDANRWQVKSGDLMKLTAAEQDRSERVRVPVWIVPGQPAGSLTVFYGYGRQKTGRVGEETGLNVYPLRTSGAMDWRYVTVAPMAERYELATTQHHHSMHGRHLARSGTLDQYLREPEHPEFAHPGPSEPLATFYDDWPGGEYRWGMTIDLTACTGCAACTIACQAENNIPVVGKAEVARNREMHWIRVDTYYQGSADDPIETLHQPVPCMHCEHAPCEVVCPVAATSHNEEGLNQMIYNRCIGTRYCSNNCPYKVRRFNFFNYSGEFLTTPSLELLSNPEVTVRSRGVMEKCTYCVQRIESARIEADKEDRPVRDGEIVTACQQACPAEAIRFGDLADTTSQVSHAHEHPLNYALLEELGTRPRTTYLAEVTNTKPGSP